MGAHHNAEPLGVKHASGNFSLHSAVAVLYHVPVRILAVCGSLQAHSTNLALLQTAEASAPESVEVTLFDGLGDLPHFNPDLDAGEAPTAVKVWRRAVAQSDAVLIASPEYGGNLPGALKNSIDWLIGSGELERKVVGITASVNHAERGRRGLEALRNALAAVSVRLVGGGPIVRGPTFESEVAGLVAALVKEVADGEEAPRHGLGWALRPKWLVTEWVEAFNRGEADALSSFYSSEAIQQHAGEVPVQGREAIRKRLAGGFATGAVTCVVENLFEDGEWAILEWRDPKGARGCGVFHVVNGRPGGLRLGASFGILTEWRSLP
jgi:NAD(P)H-dependent FMN reductase